MFSLGARAGALEFDPVQSPFALAEFAHACPGGPAVQLAGVRCERPTPRKREEAARMAVGSPSGSTCPHTRNKCEDRLVPL